MCTLFLIGIALALYIHKRTRHSFRPNHSTTHTRWLFITIIDPAGHQHFHNFPDHFTVPDVERCLKLSPNTLYTHSFHSASTPLKHISNQPILICKSSRIGGMQSQLTLSSPNELPTYIELPSPRVGHSIREVIDDNP